MQSPCAPHGLTGLHNESDGLSVVELDSVITVVADEGDVVEDCGDVASGKEDIDVGPDVVVFVDDEFAAAAIGLPISDKRVFL
jgi:hypothetical protein